MVNESEARSILSDNKIERSMEDPRTCAEIVDTLQQAGRIPLEQIRETFSITDDVEYTPAINDRPYTEYTPPASASPWYFA